MNDVATQNGTGTAVAQGQGNFFTSYGDSASQKSIVGQLLKFSKGDYMVGEQNADMPEGTELLCNMDELMVGWIKWADQKPVEQIMGRIAEGYMAPKRKDLDEQDESTWEVDETNGQPRDPWQFSNYLIMKTPGESGDDNLFTFATSSRGGLNAIGDLCKVYGKGMRTRPDEFPIVRLGVGSYQHSNKAFGRIKFPKLDVVGWTSKAEFAEALADAATAAAAQAAKDEEIPF